MNPLKEGGPPIDLKVVERGPTVSTEADDAAVVDTEPGDTIEFTVEAVLRVLPGRREVYGGVIGPAAAGRVVVKRFLPHRRQERDWRREWRGLLNLQERQLSAPTPLCVAREAEGGAIWVVMQWIPGAVSFGAAVVAANEAADVATLDRMADQLVDLVGAAHERGVWQSDQHIDNWAWDGSRLFLLDAGAMEFSNSALSARQRAADLAGVCVTVPPELERRFRVGLAERYLSTVQESSVAFVARLERMILRLQEKRARRYYKKARRTCTEFERIEKARYRCIHSRRADPRLIERFRENPEQFMEKGRCLKGGNTCTVQTFRFQGKAYVLKRYNLKSFWDRLRQAPFASRAMKSWSNSWILDMAFIPTSRAVAVYEELRGALRGRCYFLMEHVEGALFNEFLSSEEDLRSPAAEKTIRQLAEIWSGLGRLRALHGDLKATNWIVGSNGGLHLIDLDAFRFGVGSLGYRRGRARDWTRLLENWADCPEILAKLDTVRELDGTGSGTGNLKRSVDG